VGQNIKAFGLSTILAAGVNALLKFCTSLLAQNLRQKLTSRAHELYMQRKNYYTCNAVGDDKLENCDQLMCEDIACPSAPLVALKTCIFSKNLTRVLLRFTHQTLRVRVSPPSKLFAGN